MENLAIKSTGNLYSELTISFKGTARHNDDVNNKYY